MKKQNKLVLSFSGGADSSVLLHMAAKQGFAEIHTLSFDYGQRHSRELKCIQDQINSIYDRYQIRVIHNNLDVRFIKKLIPTSSLTNTEIDNPNINEMAGDAQPASYVPFRNQMFLSICCSYAESISADTVWYGAAQVDSLAGYWDTADIFINSLNSLISQNRKHVITIEAPLITMSKKDIIETGVQLGVNFKNTWTCYSNREDGLADATTPSSSLRLQGFIDAGYKDPIQYIQQNYLETLYSTTNCKEIL